jgi:hypothetical protein
LKIVSHDQLNKHILYGGGTGLEVATIGHVQFVRDEEGIWRYADSWIEVPGARDLTLSERFEPKFVVGGDGKVERVVISAESVREAPELLEWCLRVGTVIKERNGELTEILVPLEAWQERDRVPGKLVTPEYHGIPAEKELARAEREYREADRNLEIKAEKRAEALRHHAENMTRQEARRITGLSVGRIQQLIRSDSLNDTERELLQIVDGQRPKKFPAIQKTAEASDFNFPLASLRRRLRELEHRELVVATRNGFKLTKDGREALAEAKATADESAPEVEVG